MSKTNSPRNTTHKGKTVKKKFFNSHKRSSYNKFANSKSNNQFIDKMNGHNEISTISNHNPYNTNPVMYYTPQDSIYSSKNSIRDIIYEIDQLKYRIEHLELSNNIYYDTQKTHTLLLSNIQKTLDRTYNIHSELQDRCKLLEDKYNNGNISRRHPKRKTNSYQKPDSIDNKIPDLIDLSSGEQAVITFTPFSDLFTNMEHHDKKQKKTTHNNVSGDNSNATQMSFSQMIGRVLGINNNKTNEQSNDNFVNLKLPDMKKNIHKDILTIEIDNFIELDMKNLEDILNQGKKFIEMKKEYIKRENKHDIKESNTNDIKIEVPNDSTKTGKSGILNFLLQQDVTNNDDKKTKTDVNTAKDGLYMFLDKRYSINPKKIMNLVKPLEYLNSMIGMKHVKKEMYQFISHFLQNEKNHGMLNTAIYGKPGVGKTDLGKILCMIYSALEIVPSSRFTLVRASDLIGKYVGETRQKTKKIIDEADGGVLFIDEAYSLTSGSGRDTSYGKECIDTLNQELSENRTNLVVIIAGYENDIKQKFFAINPGLARRFPFRYVLNEYTKNEMKDIFLRMLRLRDDLYISSDIKTNNILELFSDMEYFDNCGGDIENLMTQIEFANSKRSLGKDPNIKGVLINDDLVKGLKNYRAHKKKKEKYTWNNMYI
jgi:SpoVK/Ycf46/Vps4 family AAA+-type ATPase